MTKLVARAALEMLIRAPYVLCLGFRAVEAINVFHVLSAGLAETLTPLVVTALFVLSVVVVLLRLDKNLLPWEIALEGFSASASVPQAWHLATTICWPFAVAVALRFLVFLIFLALLQVAIHFASNRAPAIAYQARRSLRRYFPGSGRKMRKGNRKKNPANGGVASQSRSAVPVDRQTKGRNKQTHYGNKSAKKRSNVAGEVLSL